MSIAVSVSSPSDMARMSFSREDFPGRDVFSSMPLRVFPLLRVKLDVCEEGIGGEGGASRAAKGEGFAGEEKEDSMVPKEIRDKLRESFGEAWGVLFELSEKRMLSGSDGMASDWPGAKAVACKKQGALGEERVAYRKNIESVGAAVAGGVEDVVVDE